MKINKFGRCLKTSLRSNRILNSPMRLKLTICKEHLKVTKFSEKYNETAISYKKNLKLNKYDTKSKQNHVKYKMFKKLKTSITPRKTGNSL